MNTIPHSAHSFLAEARGSAHGSRGASGTPEFEPYSETKLAHQEPFQAVSQWQELNDLNDAESIAFEMDLADCERSEAAGLNAARFQIMDTTTTTPTTPFNAALNLSDKERSSLTAWRAALERLIERSEETTGADPESLKVQLSTTLLGTFQTIRDYCSPLRHELADRATAAVAPFFRSVPEARTVAMEFPAVISLRDFTAGPALETSKRGLTEQARRAVELLATILRREPFWRLPAQTEGRN